MNIVLGKYQHFKGKFYRVISLAKCSETLEEFVVYQSLYGNFDLWIRPLKMFIENVDVNGEMVSRFKFIENE